MGTVSDVRIARRTGFCYGVREAIDAARISAADGKKTHTLGQVVHNEGVNAKLRDEGVVSVKELDEVTEGSSVVIRAHGVTPEVMASATSRELEVIEVQTGSYLVEADIERIEDPYHRSGTSG